MKTRQHSSLATALLGLAQHARRGHQLMQAR